MLCGWVYFCKASMSTLKQYYPWVPAMVQGVKNLTTAAKVTAEAHVPSLAWCSELMLSLIQCCHSCGIGHSFDSDSVPGLGNFHLPWMWPKKKKERERISLLWLYILMYKLQMLILLFFDLLTWTSVRVE